MALFSHFHLPLVLRELRIGQGASAWDFCKAAVLERGEVDGIERGQTALVYLTAARLTNVLGVAWHRLRSVSVTSILQW